MWEQDAFLSGLAESAGTDCPVTLLRYLPYVVYEILDYSTPDWVRDERNERAKKDAESSHTRRFF